MLDESETPLIGTLCDIDIVETYFARGHRLGIGPQNCDSFGRFCENKLKFGRVTL